MLWLRTVVFTILVPGTELVLLPLVVVRGGRGPRLELGPASYSGLVPLLLGLVMILRCFADFVRRGRGTPAPYDPPRELVVAGLYRYDLNPQYVGVVLVVVGEALLTGMVVLFGYTALLAIAYDLFARYYEEPRARAAVRRAVRPLSTGGPSMAAEATQPNERIQPMTSNC